VNMAGNCITDDEACSEASRMEILRRYYTALCDRYTGRVDDELVFKLEIVMKQAGVTPAIFPAIAACLAKESATGGPAGAMVLPDGAVVTGKTTPLLGCSAALLMNALKHLAGIDDAALVISDAALNPIIELKTNHLGRRNPRLLADEVLIALCTSAIASPEAKLAFDQLSKLRGCGAHFSVLLNESDRVLYKRLGINVSCEPKTETNRLFNR